MVSFLSFVFRVFIASNSFLKYLSVSIILQSPAMIMSEIEPPSIIYAEIKLSLYMEITFFLT